MVPYHGIRGQLVALAVAALLLWGFVQISERTMDGGTHAFDTRVLLLLRNPEDRSDPLGPAWVEELARDVTALGGVGVLTFVVLAVSGFLWLRDKHRSTVFLLFTITTGILLSQWLKSSFDRPRPDLVPHGSLVYTASFPSGHSLMAAIVYLTLAVLLTRTIERWAIKGYVMILAILITICVGVSRVYLGVHWPTDVLAGWIVGACWALLCGIVARWLSLRGDIERSSEFDC